MPHNAIDTAKAFADLRAFLMEAGDLAYKAQKGVKVQYKDHNQALTETDLAISRLAQTRLAGWLEQDGHVLIDEESIAGVGTPEKVFAASRYLWILDPIDGTAGYALGRPLWGISLALWDGGQPLLGGIYLPAQRALLLADTQRSWQVAAVGTDEQTETDLRCLTMPLHSQIFVESYRGTRLNWGAEWTKNRAWVNTPESAVQGFWSALTQQAAGTAITKDFCIWDIAAAAALAQRAGFAIRTLKDGIPKATFAAADFREDWKLVEHGLLCPDSMFAAIRDALLLP